MEDSTINPKQPSTVSIKPIRRKIEDMRTTLGNAILIFASLVFVGAESRAHGATATPSIINKPAAVTNLQPGATVRVNASTKLEELLALPNTTTVISSDGTQKTTVGALRASVEAQQQQLRIALRKQKLTTGNRVSVSSQLGQRSLTALATLVSQENSNAQSAHASPRAETSAVQQALNPKPGIFSVNGKSSGFIFSPGNFVTIKGLGLGKSIGKVNLISQGLPGGIMSLVVQDWRDEQIYALLPNGTRGIPDLAVTLQVIPSSGQTYLLQGGRFYASREAIAVTANLNNIIRIQFDNTWIPSYDPSTASVSRYAGLNAQGSCPAPGVDQLAYADPGKGFVVSGLNYIWGSADPGTPGYAVGNSLTNNVPVSWGVMHMRYPKTHSCFLFFCSDWGPPDDCFSDYQVSVILTGPAGVAPF
jgi:hypothetical protein